MRKCLPVVAGVTALLLFSCKKERSFDPNATSGGGNSAGQLLVKTVTKLEGNDSLRVFYTYDNQKRFISYKSEESSSGIVIKGELKFIRNAQGIVQKMVVKTDEFASVGIDSILYVINYNPGSSRYTSSVVTFDDLGTTIIDSTAYTYNTSGKIIQSEEFLDEGIGNGYVKVSKTEYTYDAKGNVIKMKNYSFNETTSSYEPYYQDEYEYDAKVNPLILGNEAFLLNDPALASPNNQTKDIYTDFEDPDLNDVTTSTYTYNTNNNPLTDIVTIQSEGFPYPTSYTYQ